MSCRRPRRLIVAPAIACFAVATAAALEPPPQPAKSATKPDWAGLDALLWAGDYARAAAAADGIATALKPARRDPDFLARTNGTLGALMRRGFAEFRLGRLDDAAATFTEAYRLAKDPEVKRLLTLEAKGGNARGTNSSLVLDIYLVDLLDLRMEVILERLRFASLAAAPGKPSAEQQAALRTQVEDWLGDLAIFEKQSVAARKAVADRLDDGGTTLLASPHNRALAGRFGPALVAGIRSLELGRLPGEGSGPAAAPADGAAGKAPDGGWLAEALRRFEEAGAALDEAVAAAAPKGAAGMNADQRIEAAVMRAELLMRTGEALVAAGEPTRAREALAQSAKLVEDIARLHKVPRPEAHPDLFVPLLLEAEAVLDEARRMLEAGDPPRARSTILEASRLLSRADALPFPADHPLRGRLEPLRARLAGDTASLAAALPATDAADAAARWMRRAIDATAAPDAAAAP